MRTESTLTDSDAERAIATIRDRRDSRYVGWGGGVPVVIDGHVVGAVAVSGLPEEEDMHLAALGVQAILVSAL